MSIISQHLGWNLPKAYNGCQCECHRVPGVKHVMACCHITSNEIKAIAESGKEALEDISSKILYRCC